jgi:hypothetical protein
MRKLLCLAILAAAFGAAVGCDDKKSTPNTKNTSSPVNTTPAKGTT